LPDQDTLIWTEAVTVKEGKFSGYKNCLLLAFEMVKNKVYLSKLVLIRE
jgi:hypothetical protein